MVRKLVGGVMTDSQAQLSVPLHRAKNAELTGGVIQGHGDDMSPTAMAAPSIPAPM